MSARPPKPVWPPRWLRILRSRPRLVAAVLVAISVALLLPARIVGHTESRLLIAWNTGALLYLGLVWHMMHGSEPEGIARRALREDEGRGAILAFVVLAAVAVLVAVGSQLSAVKDMHGVAKTLHVVLAAVTVISAWLFIQALFALHYAHDFYLARRLHAGDLLSFPGTRDPTYGDFFYFACVIGTSGQTADVNFQGSTLRGVGTVHCILAFFFNATLIALAINIAAGLL
jgi:uncharacterized membrane protein